MSTVLRRVRRFLISDACTALLFLIASVMVLTGHYVQTVLFLAFFIIELLVVCDDFAVIIAPFFMLCSVALATAPYCDVFLSYRGALVIAVLSLVFHFVVYRKPLRAGATLPGLVAVAVAVTLGGLGTISVSDYMAPGSLYYVLGLGVGMVLLYLLMKSQFSAPRDYDVAEVVIRALYAMGLLCVVCVAREYLVRWPSLKDHFEVIPFIARNMYVTFLMLAMPFPIYRAMMALRSRVGWGAAWRVLLHIGGFLLICAALLLGGSRGGLMLGGVEALLCFVYLMVYDKKHRTLYEVALGLVLLVAVAALPLVLRLYADRWGTNDFLLFSTDEARFGLLRRAWEDFVSSPLVGVGLGHRGNVDLFEPRGMEMPWYHMMIPQIFASMGLMGVAAYGYQIYGRVRLIWRTRSPQVMALALSYVGMLLISQVDPGEFCPIPNAMIVVLIFIMIERIAEAVPIAKQKQVD